MFRYLYHINLSDKVSSQGADIPFDPASVAKLFYVMFGLKNYGVHGLSKTRVRVLPTHLWHYGSGTRKLNWSHIGKSFSLLQLLEFSLQYSCNISTGILADQFERRKVNEFLRGSGFKTTIRSSQTPNRTTINDLVKLLSLVSSDFLPTDERNWLFDQMKRTQRRAVIKQTLEPQGYTVYSKGGTTFEGLRRDVAIVSQNEGSLGVVIVVQLATEMPRIRTYHSWVAKLRKGQLHSWLGKCDHEFSEFCRDLLSGAQ